MTKEKLLQLSNYDIVKMHNKDPLIRRSIPFTPEQELIFIQGFLYARWLLVKDDK